MPSLALWHGRCVDTSKCPRVATAVVATILGTLLGTAVILWLDIPLSNDIKGLVFFAAVIRMVFQANDDFIYSMDVSGPFEVLG